MACPKARQMFTTFAAHKKRPATKAGTLCLGKDAAKNKSVETICTELIPGNGSGLLYFTFVRLSIDFFDFSLVIGQLHSLCPGISVNFVPLPHKNTIKKSCRPGGSAALNRQKTRLALAELFPVRRLCFGYFGLSVFRKQ